MERYAKIHVHRILRCSANRQRFILTYIRLHNHSVQFH